jgi:hypothetical protein
MKGDWVREGEGRTAVIFVHGILSSGERCWLNPNGKYWPQLVKDENVRPPTIMLPLTEAELHEVTAQVGFALWQAHVAEETVGAYLVLVHQATPSKARDEVQAMFRRAGKSTLGQLLRAIESTGNAPQALVDGLDAFVDKRNWLVHYSRRECRKDMYSASGRASIVSRLAAIADEALQVANAFQRETEAHLEKLGVSKDQIDRDAEKLLNEWFTSA